MNDENLEIYLYNQFNQVLDSNEDATEKQTQLGNLFINASNSISAIYLTTHEKEAKEMMKLSGVDLDLKSLLRNEWYIYTNIEIWIDFLHSVYNEILPSHPQYNFFNQVMDSITMIENELGIKKETLLS